VTVCKHCGKTLVRLPIENTLRTNGWAHAKVQGSPLEEPCEIDPVTLRNKLGTKFAEPA
jgi:hypothetical protein